LPFIYHHLSSFFLNDRFPCHRVLRGVQSLPRLHHIRALLRHQLRGGKDSLRPGSSGSGARVGCGLSQGLAAPLQSQQLLGLRHLLAVRHTQPRLHGIRLVTQWAAHLELLFHLRLLRPDLRQQGGCWPEGLDDVLL